MNNASEQPLPPADPYWTASPNARCVEYAPTRDDLVEAVLSASPESKRRIVFQVIFWLVALQASCFIILMPLFVDPGPGVQRERETSYFVKASVLLVFAGLALFGFARRFVLGARGVAEKEIDKLLRNPATRKECLARVRVTVAPQGCLLQTGGANRAQTWASVRRILTTDSHCILFQDPNVVLAVVPRSAFDSDRGFRDFHEACQRFKERPQELADAGAEEPRSPDLAPANDSAGRASTTERRSNPGTLVVESAGEVPRPMYTPAERVGLYLATRGVVYFLVAVFLPAIAGPPAYFELAQMFGLPPLPRQYLLAALALTGVGILVIYLHDYRYPGITYRLFVRWQTGRVFATRADRIVSPGQPGTFFVQVVPRENWYRAMQETATDQGWMAVDAANDRILFEGIRQRWVIPASCLDSCSQIEIQTKRTTVYILLILRDGDRIAELPLLAYDLRAARFQLQERRQSAALLLAALTPLRDQAPQVDCRSPAT
jgi:hypothetical protein